LKVDHRRMNAIRLHEFGPAENLLLEALPDPEPGPDQVRIAVEASGVHLVDTTIRSGRSGGPFPLPALPTIPGREVAGTVVAAGSRDNGSWVGRRVVAHLGQAGGGYAELALAPAAALHAVPDSVTAEAAVATIGTGRTALAILEVAALRPSDVVLVLAAAGGLGALLVQAGKRAGATVVGAAGGARKAELVRGLGADIAVDYTADAWTEQVRAALGAAHVTVMLDGVGGPQGQAALDLVAVGGRLVLFGWSAGEPTPVDTSVLYARGLTASAAIGPRIFNRPGGIRSLEKAALRAVAGGELAPLVGSRFALAQAAAAHHALETRRTTGKTVLLP
jgi:NADPH2:quinone reductase